MKRLTIFVLFLFLNVDYALAEVVEIPDPNLRKVLSEAIGINSQYGELTFIDCTLRSNCAHLFLHVAN